MLNPYKRCVGQSAGYMVECCMLQTAESTGQDGSEGLKPGLS